MSKHLNLDELVSEKRVLTIDGNQYEMQEMSVKDFIEFSKEREKLDKRKDVLSDSEQMEVLVDTISKRFPTCPKDKLTARTMKQLFRIADFIRDSAEQGAPEPQQSEKAAGNG